jgi:hypothetical protein
VTAEGLETRHVWPRYGQLYKWLYLRLLNLHVIKEEEDERGKAIDMSE